MDTQRIFNRADFFKRADAEPQGLNCPVSFARAATTGSLGERLADEIAQLQAWHDVATAQRGRTTLGLTGLAPGQLGTYLGAWLGDAPAAAFREGIGPAAAIKLATDELKAFYYEAKSMQPGRRTPADIQNWFWTETAAGATFLALRDMAARSADPSMKGLATLSLVPRAVAAALQAQGVK